MLPNLNNILRNTRICGFRFKQSFRYISSSNKSIESDTGSARRDELERKLEEDKNTLQWRTPMGESSEDWNSGLKMFASKKSNSDFITMMQTPIDLSPKSIKKWWTKRNERIERFMQQYIPQRHQTLGADLAAAHFLLYRGGSVKFVHQPDWMHTNKEREIDLPSKFDPLYKIEAIRCDNMKLYYEGLENIRCLHFLKLLSFHNVQTFDDWCLDRVSGGIYPSLEVLDISGTKCTVRSLSCLYRIDSLTTLIVDNRTENLEFELTCAMLEESMPKLKIQSADC